MLIQSLQLQRRRIVSLDQKHYQTHLEFINLRKLNLENRNIQQNKDDSQTESKSKAKPKNHEFKYSFAEINLNTPQQQTRQQSQQNKFRIAIKNIEKGIQICEILIEKKKFQEAMKRLDSIDRPNLFLQYQQQIAFLRGKISIKIHQYMKAISNLQACKQYGDLDGQAVVLLSIAYGKTDNCEKGIQILSEFLEQSTAQLSPAYYDARLQKGKLLMKLKKYDLAISEFTIVSIPEKDLESFQDNLWKSDCLRLSGKFNEALMIYDSLIQNKKILIKKVYCLIELQEFGKAFEIINNILIKDPRNSQVLFLKGCINFRLGNVHEAILCFEESIKQNNNRKAVTQTLLQITKIQIEQKDFQSAFLTIQREDHLKVDYRLIANQKKFIEGVIFLIKGDCNKAIVNFTELINLNELDEFIKKKIFSYRAYGFMVLKEFNLAFQDLIYCQNQHNLELEQHYNMLICQGIIMLKQDKLNEAFSSFSKASQLNPQKMEPYFYYGLTLIQYGLRNNLQGRDYNFQNALNYLDKAVSLNAKDEFLLWFRGIMLFYFGYFQQALQDLQAASNFMGIQKKDFKIYFFKGLIKACLTDYLSSLNDIKKAINLQPKMPEIYYTRAKLFIKLNQYKQAINDLQTCFLLEPQNPEIQLQSGNLLFYGNDHKNAIRSYSQFYNIQNNAELLIQRAKCYIILKDIYQAYIDLNRVYQLTNDQKQYIDKECLNALHTATYQISKESQKILDLNLQNTNQQQVNYRKASQILKQIINLKNDGNLFMRSDLFFYRGVIKFYNGNYQKAIQNWNHSYMLKQHLIDDKNSSINSESQNLFDSIASELADLSSMVYTYNINEYHYNIALAKILNNANFEDNSILEDLAEKLPQPYYPCIKQFREAIQAEFDQNAYIFPFNNRLCQIFPRFKIGSAITRLSFCLPQIPTPTMKFEFDENFLKYIQTTDLHIKPEAPWIRRNHNSTFLTENNQSQNQNIIGPQIQQQNYQIEIYSDDSTVCLSD